MDPLVLLFTGCMMGVIVLQLIIIQQLNRLHFDERQLTSQLHFSERQDLYNRIMAKDFKEFADNAPGKVPRSRNGISIDSDLKRAGVLKDE